jgi:6-pyruvoyltetrahydropterin/6-carboxytetrahydropterin synthase
MQAQVNLARRAFFSVGCRLAHPDWDEARNREVFGHSYGPHGHDYTVDVFYRGTPSEEDGMIVNLVDIKPILAVALSALDGKFLDEEVEHFETHRPTVENIVNFVWQRLPAQINSGTLSRLRLEQTPHLWAERSGNIMKLTKKYEFAAAHRLHAPQLPEAENAARYGKCNNPRGHGHNYGLEVTVEGEPDPDTGFIMLPQELDRIVDEEVFEPFDHKHLNEDCPDFANLIPTSENLARVIFERLQGRLNRDGHRLARVGLHETQKNY